MENVDIEGIAKQLRRNYNNEWRRKNKEKVKSYNKKYWQQKALALAASEQSNDNGGNNDERKDT